MVGAEAPSSLSQGFHLSYEVVDGALQGGLDEVILHSLFSGLSQGLMGNEVSISIDQSPLGSDEVLVVISLVSSQESFSLLLHLSNLGGVELRLDFEDPTDQRFHLVLVYLSLGHGKGLLLELSQVFGALEENLLCSVEPSLDGLGVPKANLVSYLAEGEIELILADYSERGDGSFQGGASVVGVLEDQVGSYLVPQYLNVRELTDEVQQLMVLSSLNEGQALGNQVVYEAEGLRVLDDFELGTYYSEGLVSSFLLGAEGPGNGGSILQKYRNLLHSVVQVGEVESFFHGGGFSDVGTYVGPGSSTNVHVCFSFTVDVVVVWFTLHIIRRSTSFVNG